MISRPGWVHFRLSLFDDRDRLVEAAALDLVRTTCRTGSAPRRVSGWHGSPRRPRSSCRWQPLVEGRVDAAHRTILDTAACSDEEFLLRYLGGAVDTPRDGDGQANRAQRGFSSLPAPLQDRFGPDLARLLAARRARRARPEYPGRTASLRPRSAGVASCARSRRRDRDGSGHHAAGTGHRPARRWRRPGADHDPRPCASTAPKGAERMPARVTAAQALLRETPPGPRCRRSLARDHGRAGASGPGRRGDLDARRRPRHTFRGLAGRRVRHPRRPAGAG